MIILHYSVERKSKIFYRAVLPRRNITSKAAKFTGFRQAKLKADILWQV